LRSLLGHPRGNATSLGSVVADQILHKPVAKASAALGGLADATECAWLPWRSTFLFLQPAMHCSIPSALALAMRVNWGMWN
jgi:hypothetical protein